MLYSIANAASDLLILGVWSCVLERIPAGALPVRYSRCPTDKFLIRPQTYFFARDDKLYKAFQERVETFRVELAALDPQLQKQIRVLKDTLEGRSMSYRVRVRTDSHFNLHLMAFPRASLILSDKS